MHGSETGFEEAGVTFNVWGGDCLPGNQPGNMPHVDEDHIVMVRPAQLQ
jgi:hypothetical protein